MNYDVVYQDPPWAYYGQQDKWGAAAKFYDTHDFEAMVEIAHPPLSDKGVLFQWTTSAKIPESLALFEKWGLHYRGVAFVWVKTKKDGTPVGAQGVRPSIVKPLTEFVLVASRVEKGRPLKLFSESVVQTVFAPKREHSRKPDEVYDRIEALYPIDHYSHLEMFARVTRPGWDSHGNEVGKFDE